jgi:hypothetical protein
MKNTNTFTIFLVLAGIFSLPLLILAQSQRDSEATTGPGKQEGQTQPPPTPIIPDKVKLISSIGIEAFIQDLNDNGSIGYRLEKSLNYGGEGPTQSYAAVLRLDTGNKYQYDWFSSPSKKLLEGRLNFQAKRGFNFVNAFALTYCTGGSSEDEAKPTSPESLIFRLNKGDAFLLERKIGSTEQTREYKAFIAKVRLGDSAEKAIQAAIDGAPPGFRPVKILFARQGLLDFSVSVLIERNLDDDKPTKVEYRFVKKTSGLPKEVNSLAAQGFRFMTGRRVGLIGMALMDKQSSNGTIYTFVDENKFAKEFDKTVSLGNRYQGIMAGDLTCGATEVENERLVFAQNSGGEKHEYRIYNIDIAKTRNPTANSLAEFQRLLAENYQVRDLFYFGGLKVVLEK